MRSAPPKEIKTIAILRALQLGDLLCAIPAFRTLREYYPEAEISLIGLANSISLCKRFENYIDDLIIFPGYYGLPEQDYDTERTNEFIQTMNNKKFDLLIQMQGNGTYVNSLCHTLNPRYLAGFFPPEEPVDSSLFMPYPNFGHEKDRHLLLLKKIGITSKNKEMEFPITSADKSHFQNLDLKLTPKTYICIHPGSRNRLRQWPIEHFSSIGDFITQHGYQIIITGTTQEKMLAEKVCAKMHSASINLTGKTTIGSLAVLLKNSAGLISNCTGVSHIAAAIKTPSVIISMDGEPERWGPPNKALHYTHNWLKNKSYEAVKDAVKRMLININ
jgi:ADP-heptose:LPS heptosyltransferase